MPRQRTKKVVTESENLPGLDLRGLDSSAALDAVLTGLAEGRLTLAEANRALPLVEAIISVKDVATFKARLLAAEAAHKATLEATRQLAPARRQTVEVFPPAPAVPDPALSPAPWGAAS